MLKFWVLLLFTTFAKQDLVRLQSFEEGQRISVLTKYGEVVGKYEKVSILTENMTIDYAFVQKFQGIPFAQPPIGELRFKPPLEPKPWTGKIPVLKPYKYCAQDLSILQKYRNVSSSDISEDCLYLTIWVPTPARRNLAVMVFTYGSNFAHGPTLDYDFARFVALENVIVVMTNYRLGAMGFMYLDHEDCPGNMGLMDQEMAFKWTRDNIERFGGHPERITIFGHSSGSILTNFHLLNPSARYLFKRVALHSGFLEVRKNEYNKKENSLKVARIVGCGNEVNDAKLIVECLRGLDSRVLNEASTLLYDPVLKVAYYPVLDEKISLENLKRLQSAGDKEVLLGLLTSEDGNNIIEVLNEKQACPKDLFKYIANHYLRNVSDETIRIVRYYYKDHCAAIREFKEEILTTRLGTDLLYLCPAQELAEKLASAGIKTYFYQWTHRPLLSENPVWIDTIHGDELRYMFAWYDQLEGTAEIKLSRRYMAYLGSFAKYGDPNIENNLLNDSEFLERWPVYTLEEKGRLEIDPLNSTRAFGAIQEDQCRFWKHDFPLISKGMTSK